MAKFSLLVYVIFVLISQVFGQIEGDCVLEDVTEAQWQTSYPNVEVNDDHAGQFQSFKATNVKSVTLITSGNQYARYFEVGFNDENDVVVGPSADFANLERIENSDETFVSIFVRLRFECNVNTRTLTFRQPIKDLNTFTPTFNQSSYNYLLPMPLAPDFNVGCLGGRFEVCDYDITNTMLNFAVDPPEDFSVTWERAMDENNKCHYAVLTTKKNVRLADEQTYQITVTDVGTPPRSSTVSLTIQVDQANSLPSNPHFEAAFYKAIYNSEGITIPNPIYLTSGYTGITLELKGDYSQHFKPHLEADQITVTLETPLPEEVLSEDSAVFITIEADLENAEEPGRTVLIVELPERPPNPQFEYASYTATYDDDGADHSISVNGSIRLVDGYSGIRVELQGDYSEHFDYEIKSEELTVKLKSNLPEEVLEKKLPILITIDATLKDAEAPGRTVLVIELPTSLPSPQFEAASYKAIYNSENQKHTLAIPNPILLTNGYNGIKLELKGDYSQYFEPHLESDQITVTVQTNLPEEVLNEDSAVFITIEAALEDVEEPGRTVLIVELPEKPPNPQFEYASYTATYNDDGDNHSIIVNGFIRLVDGYSGIRVELQGDHSELFGFEIKTESEELTIQLNSNLPEEVLEKKLPILITIEATLKDAEAPGRAVLVVELPASPPSPQFGAASYKAIYNSEGQKHTINIPNPIHLKNGYSDIKLELKGDYSRYFEPHLESDQITVTVETNLPEEVLNEDSTVFITIEAALEDVEEPGRTVLIVELPERPSNPQFESASYTATYIVDGDNHSISVDGLIRLVDVDEYSNIQLTLIGGL